MLLIFIKTFNLIFDSNFNLHQLSMTDFVNGLWNFCSFGQVENAERHLCFPGQQVDQSELQKLRLLEKHLNRCAEARKISDWKSALRESDAAIAVGADFSPQVDSDSELKVKSLDFPMTEKVFIH